MVVYEQYEDRGGAMLNHFRNKLGGADHFLRVDLNNGFWGRL